MRQLRTISFSFFLSLCCLALLGQPANPPPNFKHQIAEVNGIKIHYVIGGGGETPGLGHGVGHNWDMWKPLFPQPSQHFTLIAPHPRSARESAKPQSGYYKKKQAPHIPQPP